MSQTVLASLFDRLTALDSDVSESGACSRSVFLNSVVRDLEFLLNSRSFGAYLETGGILCYGIPDSIGLNMLSQEDQRRLMSCIVDSITRFEPRLVNPEVTFLGHQDGGRKMLLNISSKIIFEGALEPVSFKTHFLPVGSVYKVLRG